MERTGTSAHVAPLRGRSAREALGVAVLAAAIAIAALPAGVGAAPRGDQAGPDRIAPRKGIYRGKTQQQSVASSARGIEFRVTAKGRRIELTVEPTVVRDFCVAPPVFVVDGVMPSARLKRGRFAFTRTFVGDRVDRIAGHLVAPDEIEGEATYNFPASDAGLCSAGSTKIRFSAKRRGGGSGGEGG